MKKIAIFTCLKACKVCSSTACFKAFNNKSGHFTIYNNQEIQLTAFLHCNGCGSNLDQDQDLHKKLDKIITEQVNTVHFGICTSKKNPDHPDMARIECSKITPIVDYLKAHGVEVVRGTHE